MDTMKSLKEEATKLGLTYSPNIGYDTLRKRVEAARSVITVEDSPIESLSTFDSRQEALKLVRCIITCKNPNKLKLEGEVISAGNAKFGFIKKFVQFNKPYHLPVILYNAIKEREFTTFTRRVLPNGEERTEAKLVPEFDISILPPLTKDEFEKIKIRQAMSRVSEEL